jgi:Tol biopolymer transport system component
LSLPNVANLPANGEPRRRTVVVQDGKAIMYVNTKGTVSNLWLKPTNGGTPKPLTDFKENQITAFAWSPDGSQLALSRGVRTKDVVVLR